MIIKFATIILVIVPRTYAMPGNVKLLYTKNYQAVSVLHFAFPRHIQDSESWKVITWWPHKAGSLCIMHLRNPQMLYQCMTTTSLFVDCSVTLQGFAFVKKCIEVIESRGRKGSHVITYARLFMQN